MLSKIKKRNTEYNFLKFYLNISVPVLASKGNYKQVRKPLLSAEMFEKDCVI